MAPEENEETEVLIEKTKEEYEAERERDRKKHKEVLEMVEKTNRTTAAVNHSEHSMSAYPIDLEECQRNIEVLQRDD